jgi:hypothetical protein
MDAMKDRQLDELKRRLDYDSRQADRRSDRMETDLRDLRSAVRAESHSTQLLILQLGVTVVLVFLIGFAMIASRL